MSVTKKRPTSRNQLAKMPEAARYGVLDLCHDELKKMLKDGIWIGKPKEWHPAKVLVRLIYDPASDNTMKFWCAKELLQYTSAPKAAQLRIEANGPIGDTNIQIVVAPWASDGQERRADVVVEQKAIDVTPSRS